MLTFTIIYLIIGLMFCIYAFVKQVPNMTVSVKLKDATRAIIQLIFGWLFLAIWLLLEEI